MLVHSSTIPGPVVIVLVPWDKSGLIIIMILSYRQKAYTHTQTHIHAYTYIKDDNSLTFGLLVKYPTIYTLPLMQSTACSIKFS